MTIDANPTRPERFADYFDGRRAVPQRAGLSIFDSPAAVLALTLPDGTTVRWPLADLRGIPDQADRTSLVHGSRRTAHRDRP
jgi:hypothetical protein